MDAWPESEKLVNLHNSIKQIDGKKQPEQKKAKSKKYQKKQKPLTQ